MTDSWHESATSIHHEIFFHILGGGGENEGSAEVEPRSEWTKDKILRIVSRDSYTFNSWFFEFFLRILTHSRYTHIQLKNWILLQFFLRILEFFEWRNNKVFMTNWNIREAWACDGVGVGVMVCLLVRVCMYILIFVCVWVGVCEWVWYMCVYIYI